MRHWSAPRWTQAPTSLLFELRDSGSAASGTSRGVVGRRRSSQGCTARGRARGRCPASGRRRLPKVTPEMLTAPGVRRPRASDEGPPELVRQSAFASDWAVAGSFAAVAVELEVGLDQVVGHRGSRQPGRRSWSASPRGRCANPGAASRPGPRPGPRCRPRPCR